MAEIAPLLLIIASIPFHSGLYLSASWFDNNIDGGLAHPRLVAQEYPEPLSHPYTLDLKSC